MVGNVRESERKRDVLRGEFYSREVDGHDICEGFKKADLVRRDGAELEMCDNMD